MSVFILCYLCLAACVKIGQTFKDITMVVLQSKDWQLVILQCHQDTYNAKIDDFRILQFKVYGKLCIKNLIHT